jgi:hypothetical protein
VRYDSGQFGSFEGLDNRKTVLDCFVRLGHELGEVEAAKKRAWFLQGLLSDSTNGFADKMVRVSPCTAVDAYMLFVAITGVLGVPVERAAKRLEEYVR